MDVTQGNTIFKKAYYVDCQNIISKNNINSSIKLQGNNDDETIVNNTDYTSYNWLDDIDNFYKDSANIFNLQSENENNHIFFDDNDDDDYDDDYNQSSDSSSSDSSDEEEQPNKKNKIEDIYSLRYELNDLKKDTINNSSSLDHILIALDNLKQICEENSKSKVSVIINKFKQEIYKLDDLKSSPGITLFDDMFLKYKNAYSDVYKMIKKEYTRKKEKFVNKFNKSEADKKSITNGIK